MYKAHKETTEKQAIALKEDGLFSVFFKAWYLCVMLGFDQVLLQNCFSPVLVSVKWSHCISSPVQVLYTDTGHSQTKVIMYTSDNSLK